MEDSSPERRANLEVVAYTTAALVLLAFLLATNIYRAAHQSITIDEAFTYEKHIAAWKFWKFQEYTANNHVLNTLLCKLSIGIFGLSEFAIRIPSLLGGLLYFIVLFRISSLLFGRSVWFPLSIALNALNPLILDFMSVARGYGMGLAFFTWGLFYALESLTRNPPLRSQAIKAGTALGLGIASQLTYATPSVALTVVFTCAALAGSRAGWKDSLRPAIWLGASGAVVAGAILVWPMRNAHLGNFYVGESTLRQSLHSLVPPSLFYKATLLNQAPLIRRAFFESFPDLLFALWCGVGFSVWRANKSEKMDTTQKYLLIVASLILTWYLLQLIGSVALVKPFPSDRMGLYLFPLISFTCLLTLRTFDKRGGLNRVVTSAGILILSVYALQYALEYNVSYYWVYRSDAGIKLIVDVIRRLHQSDGNREIKVGASWHLAEGINFYRVMYKANWMDPVTRDGPDCYYDYYVLAPFDLKVAGRYGVEEVYRDSLGGALLGKPAESRLRKLAAIYPPPIERTPPCGVDPEKIDSFARKDDAEASLHFVRDIMGGSGGHWTYDRPILLFRVDKRDNLKFVMHFLVPDVLFAQTGPITLSVWINTRQLGQRSYNVAGEHVFEQNVPPEIFGGHRLAAVEIRTDKYFISPETGGKLGILLVDAGLAPETNAQPTEIQSASKRSKNDR